eukprot:41225-Hanusia_phi.AAC.1
MLWLMPSAAFPTTTPESVRGLFSRHQQIKRPPAEQLARELQASAYDTYSPGLSRRHDLRRPTGSTVPTSRHSRVSRDNTEERF